MQNKPGRTTVTLHAAQVEAVDRLIAKAERAGVTTTRNEIARAAIIIAGQIQGLTPGNIRDAISQVRMAG